MSDAEYIKWKKKHKDDPIEPWIELILNTPNPTDKFCIDVYNRKSEIKQQNTCN